MSLNFEKFAQEGNEFMNKLAANLGHPQERDRVGIVLKSVLHTLRDRIHFGESLDFISQLPMALKALYVEQWKYKEPENFQTMEEFCNAVEAEQRKFGEREFNWNKSTEEIVKIVFNTIAAYVTPGQLEHVMNMLPDTIKPVFEESISKAGGQ